MSEIREAMRLYREAKRLVDEARGLIDPKPGEHLAWVEVSANPKRQPSKD